VIELIFHQKLDWIPFLSPQVAIERGGPWDPRMLKRITLMACHRRGKGPKIQFTSDFFGSLENQIIMIEDFPYIGMDYTSDLDMPLPIGIQWGDLGKNFTLWLF